MRLKYKEIESRYGVYEFHGAVSETLDLLLHVEHKEIGLSGEDLNGLIVMHIAVLAQLVQDHIVDAPELFVVEK